MSSKNNIIVFCYSATNTNFSFFNKLRFTNQASHKSLVYLYSFDRIDEKTNIMPADIIFLEESATIPKNLYSALVEAKKVYVIYSNPKKTALEKLTLIRKGDIHRKIIDTGVEKQVAIELVSNLSTAFYDRKESTYEEYLEQLRSLFTNNFLQEAQLIIMHACSNKSNLRKILANETNSEPTYYMINKLLENSTVKDILQRLSSEELTDKDAVNKIKAQLRLELFPELKEAA